MSEFIDIQIYSAGNRHTAKAYRSGAVIAAAVAASPGEAQALLGELLKELGLA